MNNQKTKKGFTIIEVVLVLAIAGLIFLMVFVALPALQRSQRDTQRRNDYAMLSTAITNYMANNRGKLPTRASSTKLNEGQYTGGLNPATYINADGTDPNGYIYKIEIGKCKHENTIPCTLDDADSSTGGKGDNGPSTLPDTAMMSNYIGGGELLYTSVFVVTNADCSGVDENGNAAPVYNASSRAFAIYGPLETTGSYCSNSK